jgi:hypothetical protein
MLWIRQSEKSARTHSAKVKKDEPEEKYRGNSKRISTTKNFRLHAGNFVDCEAKMKWIRTLV